ncbi:MAG TPA: hypothetical protein VGU02_02220 [Gaiellaceae bacterium]|nr:hypothetical protein [Gaiellaceae bacterium]
MELTQLTEASTGARILIVASGAVDDRLAEVLAGEPQDVQIVVVAPALTSRLNYWSSDDRRSRQAAQNVIDCVLAELAALDYAARGQVGDADPLQAVADALCVFPAEKVIVASHLEARPNWLARDLVLRIRAGFQVEVVDIATNPRPAQVAA